MCRSIAGDPTVFDQYDTIGEIQNATVMCYDNNSALLLMREIPEYRHDNATVLRIESGRRLISEHHARRSCESTRDRYALVLTTTQIGWVRVALFCKFHLIEKPYRSSASLAATNPLKFECDLDVLAGRQCWK